MKINIQKGLALVALSLSLGNFSSAQTYGKGIVGLGNHNPEINHIGYFGETEVFSMSVATQFGMIHRLYAYNNKKKVGQEAMSIDFNGKKYVPEKYFIHNNTVMACFIASDASESTTSLYLLEIGENLKQKGSAIKIMDLPHAMDGGKFKATFGTPLFVKEPVKYQELELIQSEETGSVIFSFSLRYEGKVKASYAKIIVLDSDLKVELTKDYEAKSTDNVVVVELHKFFDNQDLFFSVSEGSTSYEKNVQKFYITRYGMVFLPGDGEEFVELDLTPEYQKIKGVKVADKMDENGKYYYGIYSVEEEEDGGEAISLYSFDPKSGKLDSGVAEIKGKAKLHENSKSAEMSLARIFPIGGDKVLVDLNGRNNGSMALSLSANGDVNWATMARPAVTGAGYANGSFIYVSEDEAVYVYNIHPKFITGGKFNMEKSGLVDFGSLPCTSRLDLETGAAKYELLNAKGNTLGGINFLGSHSEKNGLMHLKMKFNGAIQVVPVNFVD